jgi:uncharacterized protein
MQLFITARAGARIVGRGALFTILVSAFFVLVQDFLVFPLLINSVFGLGTAPTPPGWDRHLVTSSDGIRFELFHKSGAPGGRHAGKTALFFHGNGMTAPQFHSMQEWLAHLGFSTYQMEFRGYGNSEGWPRETSLYSDAEAAYRFIRNREPAEGELLIVGNSVGTGIATELATRVRPAALLLVAGYSSIPDVARGIPLFAHLIPFLRFEFPAAAHLARLDRTCVVSTHGRRDGTIPFGHQAALAAAYRGSGGFFAVSSDDAGHADVLGKTLPAVEAALDRCLRSAR